MSSGKLDIDYNACTYIYVHALFCGDISVALGCINNVLYP
jgi:hypothetical protein